MADSLPRLAYIADVGPVDSVAGFLLLHRLFSGYPRDRLWVVAPSSGEDRRSPSAGWTDFRLGWERLQRTRFHRLSALAAIARSVWPPNRVEGAVGAFRPDAIVTLLHGSGWIAASRLARRQRIQLAMIVHDDRMTHCECFQGALKGWAQGMVREAYRQAGVRFCISPEMRDAYRGRYGADANVLYPSLAPGAVAGGEAMPPGGDRKRNGSTFFYAGSVRSHGIKRQLAILGRIAVRRGHRVVALTPDSGDLRADPMLRSAGVEIRDAVAADAARRMMDAEADVLIAGIDAKTGDNARYLFPTKLAEYTSLGRPILLCSPKGTAAANWAEGPPMRALCVEDPVREEDLERAVERLENDAGFRATLGAAALSEARERFSHEAVFGVFMDGILKALGTRR
ncbi:MAG: glycosyltransferase [Verrucomicrobiae bacterium]|nr:glycosyltransferase [Verrucomicrobiae bacterium]